MPNYKFGDVVLMKFPFTNNLGFKKRPALVIKDTNDVKTTEMLFFIQRRKGLTEKRAKRNGPWGEAFFCLDFLVTFVSRQK